MRPAANTWLIAVLLAAMGLANGGVAASSETGDLRLNVDDAALVALGRQVYADQCASCHGAELEGQPDWRRRRPDGKLPAPPHDETGHTWHHDDAMLFRLTKFGLQSLLNDPSYATDMPAYDGVLSDREIIAVLSFIKSAWSQEIRERHDLINGDRP